MKNEKTKEEEHLQIISPFNKITLTKRNFMSKKKLIKLEDKELNDIMKYITPDDNLKLELLSKTTTKISIINYGPILTIYDFEKLCYDISNNVDELKFQFDQLFYQFYFILMSQKKNDFTIKNKNIMIIKETYCLIISFGISNFVEFCINLTTGITCHNSKNGYILPYNPKLLEDIWEFYNNNLIKYVDRILSRMKMDSVAFEKDIDERINNCLSRYESDLKDISNLEIKREETKKNIIKLEEERKDRKEKHKNDTDKFSGFVINKKTNPYTQRKNTNDNGKNNENKQKF